MRLMLVENQWIKMRWHYKNKSHFESKGYKFTSFGDDVMIKAEDLRPESHEKVMVKCDGCGEVFNRDFRDYVKEHDNEYGDCCRKCNRKKAVRTNRELYGVDWCLQREDFKQKQKDTCLEKYGVEYISQDASFRQAVINSCRERYGVDNVSYDDSVKKKKIESFYKNGTCPTSKPQLELHNILEEMYGHCDLNYPLSWYSLDCFIEVNGVGIDVEFDGSYWHTGKEDKDARRDKYVQGCGYKVLRFFSSGKLPTKEQIKTNVDALVNTDTKYIRIDMT